MQTTKQSLSKRMLSPMINPAHYDFWSQQFGSISAWERCFARVIAIKKEAKNTKTLILKANRNWHGFTAGQHCNVTACIDGRNITRSYTISSAPSSNRHIEITVRLEQGGLMSSHLNHQIRIGDRLELGQPYGQMLLPKSDPSHLLLLAAGSGITPMMSHIRHLANRGMPFKVSLMYWEKTLADACFLEELHAIAERHSNFDLKVITTQETGTKQLHGRISKDQLSGMNQIDSVDLAFACGANGFVEAARELCDSRPFSFQCESFTPTNNKATTENLSEFVIGLKRTGQTVQVTNQSSLLSQLEVAGVSVPSGCRQGICNTCVCVRQSGTTKDASTGDTDNEPSQIIKLCVTHAASNLELDL